MSADGTRTRLRKEDRREQLLDAAERLLVERGPAAMTMERLAEYAGVSKALPYSHFDNSDQVLVAVHQRVTTELGQRIVDALDASSPDDDRAALVVRVYFDAVKALGPILAVVSSPGSRVVELAEAASRGSRGVPFVGRVLHRYLDVDRERAEAAAPILLSALTGAVRAWGAGQAPRSRLEPLCVAVAHTLVAPAPS